MSRQLPYSGHVVHFGYRSNPEHAAELAKRTEHPAVALHRLAGLRRGAAG